MLDEKDSEAKSQSYLVETLSRVELVKASGREDYVVDHWSTLLFNHLNVAFRRSLLSARIDTIMSALKTFSPLALLWTGAYLVLTGGLSLGMMLALTSLATAFLTPLSSLVASGQRLQLVGSHLDRLTDVLETAPEQNPEETGSVPRLTGRIEIRKLSFRYNSSSPLILNDISILIHLGQKVALVGRTGAGKSTLAKLILGLYQPTTGEILYDDLPLSSLNFRPLRQQIGVIHQETQLISGSIRLNIAFGNPEMPMEQVRIVEHGTHEELLAQQGHYASLIHNQLSNS